MPPSGTTPRPPALDVAALTVDDSRLEPEIDLYRTRLVGSHVDTVGHGELAEVLIDGADLSGSQFDTLDLSDVRIERADLAGANWDEVSARRLEVTGCRLTGWRLHVNFTEHLLVDDCRWDQGALFLGRARGSVVFRACDFRGTTLRGDLSGVVFDGCDLAGAEFGATATKNCDLRTSRLVGANGLTRLAGAIITTDQAIGLADQLAVELGFQLA